MPDSLISQALAFLQSLSPVQQWLAVAAVTATYLLITGLQTRKKRYVDVPVTGKSGMVSSYFTAVRSILKGYEPVIEGYNKYKGRAFKTAEISRWHVWVSGSKLMEQLRVAGDDLLESVTAQEHLQADVLVNPTSYSDRYHEGLISHLFTRQLLHVFPTMAEEMRLTFEDTIPRTDDWTSVKILDVVARNVCRITNRIFVGDRLCRDEGWITINVKFTMEVALSAIFITPFPQFMKGFVAQWLTPVPRRRKTAEKLILPIILERMDMIEKLGKDSEELPMDSITWLLNHASVAEREPKQIASRILLMNIAAIHTTAMSFTQVLFHLCAYPEYIAELRAEVEAALDQDGWSKFAMLKCRKLDSFIKEVLRMNPGTIEILERQAMKDFHLIDGTFIPKGTRIGAVSEPMMLDPEVWGADADKFDGYRFSKLRENDATESNKNQIVQTAVNFVPFGHGRHACPGRFFAANELKALSCYILMNYDIKFKDESLTHGKLPKKVWAGTVSWSNPTEEILFRKRQT